MKFFNTRSIHYGILAVSSVISAIATTTYAGVALIQYEHAEQYQAHSDLEVNVSTAIPEDIIDFDKAVSIARNYAQGKVLEAALSQKQGKLVYIVDFNDHGKISVVWVDALNGAIREI